MIDRHPQGKEIWKDAWKWIVNLREQAIEVHERAANEGGQECTWGLEWAISLIIIREMCREESPVGAWEEGQDHMVLEAQARGLKNEGKKREDNRDLAENQLI